MMRRNWSRPSSELRLSVGVLMALVVFLWVLPEGAKCQAGGSSVAPPHGNASQNMQGKRVDPASVRPGGGGGNVPVP